MTRDLLLVHQSKISHCVIPHQEATEEKKYDHINSENIFHKIHQSFMMKALNRLGIQGNFSSLKFHPLYTYSQIHNREREIGYHHGLEPNKDVPSHSLTWHQLEDLPTTVEKNINLYISGRSK